MSSLGVFPPTLEYKSALSEVKVKSLSRVRLFATPWTVTYQAPLSMDFPGNSTGMDCHFLLQRIFPTQGSNPGLLHCRQTLYRLSHQGTMNEKKKLGGPSRVSEIRTVGGSGEKQVEEGQ